MKARTETINNKRIVYTNNDNIIRKDEINAKNFINKNSNDVIVANQITLKNGAKTTAKVITELTPNMLYTATAEDVKKNSNLTANETYIIMPYNERVFYLCRVGCNRTSKNAYKILLVENDITTAIVDDRYISFDWEDEADCECEIATIGHGICGREAGELISDTTILNKRSTIPSIFNAGWSIKNYKGTISGIIYVSVAYDYSSSSTVYNTDQALIKASITNKTINCINYKMQLN